MEKEIGQFTLNEMFQTCKEYNDENVKWFIEVFIITFNYTKKSGSLFPRNQFEKIKNL